MFIEKRKVKERIKYYLVHSFRDGKAVMKIRKYLGVNLTEKELKEKRKQLERIINEEIKIYKEIKNPLSTALSSRELKILQLLKPERRIKIRHLSKDEWIKFGEKFIYDTNAIEGSTVTIKEVKDILEKDKWPEHATKWEVSETYGVEEAIDFIKKTKEELSIKLIKEIHRITFENSKRFAGKLRPRGVNVVIQDAYGKIVHRGAPPEKIKSLLNELIKWYKSNKKKYSPLILAVIVHNQFETIHPFQDGNGRVGRLLLNNILLKHGLPPVNIQLKHRKEYYKALQEYQNNGYLRPMIELIIKEYKEFKRLVKKR